jgi:outer membrane protein assembly factor BamA
LSVAKRIELGAAYEFYHQSRILDYLYYDQFYILREQERVRLNTPPGTGFYNVNTAYVGDNSHFGLTSPLHGWRYRIGLEQYLGNYQFSTLLLDGRKYFRLKPVTLAVRGIAYGREGRDADAFTQFSPLFVGNSWFVRGFNSSDLFIADSTLFQQTIGRKILIANFEIRLPFTGPKPLALFSNRAFLSDLNLFFDAGLAFNDRNDLKAEDPTPDDNQAHVQHKPIFSAGFSLRINLFGAIILEPYMAIPLSVDKEQQNFRFGLNFVPGW